MGPRPGLGGREVQRIVDGLFGEDLYAKRVLLLAHGTLGLRYASSLAIHAVGPGLAAARSRLDRRAVKQVDQHLSNRGIDLNPLGAPWVNVRMGDRPQAGVKLDWTACDGDDHTLFVASVQTANGDQHCSCGRRGRSPS